MCSQDVYSEKQTFCCRRYKLADVYFVVCLPKHMDRSSGSLEAASADLPSLDLPAEDKAPLPICPEFSSTFFSHESLRSRSLRRWTLFRRRGCGSRPKSKPKSRRRTAAMAMAAAATATAERRRSWKTAATAAGGTARRETRPPPRLNSPPRSLGAA